MYLDCLTRHVSVVALSYRVSLRKLARKIDNVEGCTRRTRGASLQTARNRNYWQRGASAPEYKAGVDTPRSPVKTAGHSSGLSATRAANAYSPRIALAVCTSASRDLQVAGRKPANRFGNDILANGGNLGQHGGEALQLERGYQAVILRRIPPASRELTSATWESERLGVELSGEQPRVLACWRS